MSLTPETTPTSEPAQAYGTPPPIPRGKQLSGLRRRLWVILFAIFAFEIGTFLLVFPWMDSWNLNHLPSLFPRHEVDLQDLWDDPYFRGAISCLGLLNIYIAVREAIRLNRRVKKT
ncbi:MAG: hypothetical protein ABI833_10760 [Acidobacteriota bacterium]